MIVKIGMISYLNTLPIYYGIEKGLVRIPRNVVLVKGVPTVLNKLLIKEEIDLSVISSFEYARNYKKLLIIPGFSIAAKEKVMSVLFLSKVKIEELSNKKVMLTNASLTSKKLLLLYFKLKGIKPLIEEFEYSRGLPESDHDGILLIGDDALRYLHNNGYTYSYDLAELWHQLTGLPFVFALWCITEKSVREKKCAIEKVLEMLTMSKELSKKKFKEIAKEKSKELNISTYDCEKYLRTLHFDLNEEYIIGMKEFFRLMKVEGFLDHEPEIRFYS